MEHMGGSPKDDNSMGKIRGLSNNYALNKVLQ